MACVWEASSHAPHFVQCRQSLPLPKRSWHGALLSAPVLLRRTYVRLRPLLTANNTPHSSARLLAYRDCKYWESGDCMSQGIVRVIKDLTVVVEFDDQTPDIHELVTVDKLGTQLLVDSV